IGRDTSAKRKNLPIPVAHDLQIAFHLPRVIGPKQVFESVLNPLDGTPEPHGRKRHQEIFRIELSPHTTPSSHVDLDHVYRIKRKTEHRSKCTACRERYLGGTVYRHVLALGIPICD